MIVKEKLFFLGFGRCVTYPETGEDPALTFTERSTPVDGVHGLNVENRPPEQLHHVLPQLHFMLQARAVGGCQALRYKRQIRVSRKVCVCVTFNKCKNKSSGAACQPANRSIKYILGNTHSYGYSQLCSWRSNQGV